MVCEIADIIKMTDYYPLGTTVCHFMILEFVTFQSFDMHTLLYKVVCLETGNISTCSFEETDYVTYQKVA